MNFNEAIKKALKNKKISAYRMAKDLQISEGQLSRFLNHNDQMGKNNIQKMFDYLGIEIKV
jgi:transcriptional regulator with XRE-family HTH domain